MKQLAVLSGKGGTGKTTVVASLAHLLAPVLVVDCDVDAANLALLLPGEDSTVFTVRSGFDARVDVDRCTGCGACLDACRFDAIVLVAGKATIRPLLCEGCSACSLVCPAGAVQRLPRTAGAAWLRPTAVGPLVHAELAVAQDNSGHLVTYIRDMAQRVAERVQTSWMLLDGPPGLGCPVQATLAGVDRVLVVVEPSASSAADLSRLLQLLQQLALPAAVLVNKWDIVPDAEALLGPVCARWGVPIVAKLPHSTEVPRCLSRGQVPGCHVHSIRDGLTGVRDWLEHPQPTVPREGGGACA